MGEAKDRLMRIGEDTITGMARRAFEEFRRLEMKSGARMKEWDHLPILVRANWKDIIGRGLGNKGTLVNCNPALVDGHTLLITGLTDAQAEGIRAGLEQRLGGTVEKPAMDYSDKAFAVEPEAEAHETVEHPEIGEPEGQA